MIKLDGWLRELRSRVAYKKALKLCGSLKGKRIVDLGAGTGEFASFLRSKGCYVLTVDKVGGDVITDLNCRLPFKDDEFDVAFSLAVVEHLENPYLFLAEVKRIAKVCVLTTPHKRAEPVLKWLAKLKLINEEHVKDHKYYFTEEELRLLGFETTTFEFGLNILFWKDSFFEKFKV